MGTLATIFQIPVLLLNFFGFIVSAIWLLVIGEWKSVLLGGAISIFAPFFLGIATFPAAAFGLSGIYFAKKGITIGLYFFSFLSSIYIAVLITGWSGTITFYFLHNVPAKAFWPMLVWSYGVATSPWTYIAQKDGSAPSLVAAFFMQIAYIVMMISIAAGLDLPTSAQIFSIVMAVGVLFHMRLIADMKRSGILNADN